MSSIAETWGSTPAERAMMFPSDARIEGVDAVLFRAVGVDAPPGVVFRWLCQLRVAPYSYDWLDNPGKTSPRELTSGLEKLERGQRVMDIFELADFEPDRHITLVLTSEKGVRAFGKMVVSYLVYPTENGKSRLVAKLCIKAPKLNWLWRLRVTMLAWGDFIMMRKQLLTLKRLAERSLDPSLRL